MPNESADKQCRKSSGVNGGKNNIAPIICQCISTGDYPHLATDCEASRGTEKAIARCASLCLRACVANPTCGQSPDFGSPWPFVLIDSRHGVRNNDAAEVGIYIPLQHLLRPRWFWDADTCTHLRCLQVWCERGFTLILLYLRSSA
jgi:hypothetical protein